MRKRIIFSLVAITLYVGGLFAQQNIIGPQNRVASSFAIFILLIFIYIILPQFPFFSKQKQPLFLLCKKILKKMLHFSFSQP